MSSFASTSSQSRLTFEYDVFLILRDPQNVVRTCLENGLRDAGIRTFIDGTIEYFPVQQVIEKSRIVVVVFTPEFVESDICLKRLVNIMWCHKTMNKLVLTAFSGVSQEQVITELEDLERRKLAAWELEFDLVSRRAIAEAAAISGFSISSWMLSQRDDSNKGSPVISLHSDQLSDFDGFTKERLEELENWTVPAAKANSEADDSQSDMDMIISESSSYSDLILASSVDMGKEKVLNNDLMARLDECLFCNLPSHAIGLRLRAKEVLHLLEWEKPHVKDLVIIGIWGAGGIGKTTIVRAIYDRIGVNFESKSFLTGIKHVWEKHNGRLLLWNQLLSDISESEFDEINDEEVLLERRRSVLHKRALVVLDDVNQLDQIIELCGKREQFGAGSLIFITTRDRDILDHIVDKSYEMRRLDSDDSFKLFSWHAFKKYNPTNDFFRLSWKIIHFCEGIPLVLEVFGSLLHNRTISDWENVLTKLKGIRDGHIQKKLKISFDFLTDLEKDLFFSIASFYVGQSEKYVTHALKGSRFPVEMVMRVLIERTLVKVINRNLHVHELLQMIGREISPKKLKLKYIYDVFLSFRGEDTRKSFTTHLYTYLRQAGIEVYMDEERIERGKNISSSLLRAIECSRISIIIFSKNYAGSSWCLQELEKIMECYKTNYQEVLPIFYDVEPYEVRKQQNAFGKALKKLIRRPLSGKGKKLALKKALTEAANLSGWDMKNFRTERELIDHVIEAITMKIESKKCLFVAHRPVGLESRVQDIIQLLNSKSNEIIIAGIWGMGGIGKTTVSKTIYNEIGENFEGKCFLANVREVWEQDNGHVYLQEQLLSDILKSRKITIPNTEVGKTLIKEVICKKRVLVVLDDLNNEDQIKALFGSREWFGRGSRIVITTRDERILQILQVVNVFNVKEMDENESMELFSWHAFKQATPKRDFIEVSRNIVSYSRGLPLALEILGSYLFGRELSYWECVLKKLQQIPCGQIYEVLKISYDGLTDQTEKDIFFDICCFFIGKDISYATQILNGCDLHADIGITHLIERSLVKVGYKNKLEMHDLIRDMGRGIIREQSQDVLENRTRLWCHDDVLKILRNCTGKIAAKGLALKMSRHNSLSLDSQAFEKMQRLRLLQLDFVQLVGNYGYLSKELRWLCWHGFSFESMPKNLSLEKIIVIDLKWSNLTKLWEKSQLLEGLKILNLSHSLYLTETPNFSKLPHLEKLLLKDCPLLSTIHPSIGGLRYIILLNLKDCKGLSHLPRSIYKLKSLKTLNLSGCSKIEKLEEEIEQMESLTILVANQIAVAHVPVSLVRLKCIKYVSLCGYEGLTRDLFPSLVLSWMSPINHSKSLFQAFGMMSSLSNKGLSHPMLDARPSTSQSSCREIHNLIGFHEQVHMNISETSTGSLTIRIGGFSKVIDTLLQSISQGCSERGLYGNSLPGDNYPYWLNFKGEGHSILIEVPHIIERSLKGLILCIICLSSQDNMTTVYPIDVLISNQTKDTIEFYKIDAVTSSKDDEWQDIISNLEPGNKVQVVVTFANQLTVKSTIIYLIYEEEISNKIMY